MSSKSSKSKAPAVSADVVEAVLSNPPVDTSNNPAEPLVSAPIDQTPIAETATTAPASSSPKLSEKEKAKAENEFKRDVRKAVALIVRHDKESRAFMPKVGAMLSEALTRWVSLGLPWREGWNRLRTMTAAELGHDMHDELARFVQVSAAADFFGAELATLPVNSQKALGTLFSRCSPTAAAPAFYKLSELSEGDARTVFLFALGKDQEACATFFPPDNGPRYSSEGFLYGADFVSLVNALKKRAAEVTAAAAAAGAPPAGGVSTVASSAPAAPMVETSKGKGKGANAGAKTAPADATSIMGQKPAIAGLNIANALGNYAKQASAADRDEIVYTMAQGFELPTLEIIVRAIADKGRMDDLLRLAHVLEGECEILDKRNKLAKEHGKQSFAEVSRIDAIAALKSSGVKLAIAS